MRPGRDCPASVNPQRSAPLTLRTRSELASTRSERVRSSIHQGSLGTVGQAKTTSPWGTLDQGGNAAEWTDTITPPWQGRVAGGSGAGWTAESPTPPAYQLWLSAVGLQPQNNAFFDRT